MQNIRLSFICFRPAKQAESEQLMPLVKPVAFCGRVL